MWVCSLKNKWKHVNTFPFQLFDAITQGEITRGRVLEWSPNCSPFVVGWGFFCCSRKEILKWVNIAENKASCLTVDYFTYLYQIKPIWLFFSNKPWIAHALLFAQAVSYILPLICSHPNCTCCTHNHFILLT